MFRMRIPELILAPGGTKSKAELDLKDPGLMDTFVTQFKLDPYAIEVDKPGIVVYTEQIQH